ncbi:hypothetical protein [Rhizobacter fulvus]
MKLFFLPFVREGFMPTAAAGARSSVHLDVQLTAAGHASRDVGKHMPLLGPGDVLGVDPRQVLRVTPTASTHDAETEFFPAIEFDAPDLPWLYSPVLPEGRRVPPWLVLVVVEASGSVNVLAGAQGQSRWKLQLPAEVAARELPDLGDSWAWAHAQVACGTQGEIAGTLVQSPDRALSRLLSPRRLLPLTAYHACVVPAYLTGRIAGLGGDPAADAAVVTGHEPAWSETDLPTELPVYWTWSFRTGEAGDFESLAQRLRATPLDAAIPPMPLHLAPPVGTGSLEVDWRAPLRVPRAAALRDPRPAEAVSALTDALQPDSDTRPVLGPAFFGEPWTPDKPLAPMEDWRVELNLTPMWRAAAGLGAEAVRNEQDALVAAASEQLEAFRAQQREGRRRQLMDSCMGRVAQRLQRAPASESARVFAPLAVLTQQAASNVGAFTVAGRRIDRKSWQTVRQPGRVPTTGLHGNLPDLALAPTAAPLPSGGVLRFIDAVRYRPAVVRVPVTAPPAPPVPTPPQTIPAGAFSPRFARPMSEPLAERNPELMLPNAGAIGPDSALLVEGDNAFVEAYLVGANQELQHELLWRGLPADPEATAFRRFWPRTGGGDDIGDIAEWAAGSRMGEHVISGASMILLVRSELVRRYPSLLVALIPAQWKSGGRLPLSDAAQVKLPMFRARIGADMLYAGFEGVSLVDAIGTTAPPGDPGWFFMLSENPGDARFGLDPPGNTAPPTRSSLSWSHLAVPPTARYAVAGAFPAVPDADFTPANATAAAMAGLVRQRPFRAFLHSSLLVRLPESP